MRDTQKIVMLVLVAVIVILAIVLVAVVLMDNSPNLEEQYSDDYYRDYTPESVSIDAVVSAFRTEGYTIEQVSAEDDPDMNPNKWQAEGLTEIEGYHFGKRNRIDSGDYLVEEGEICFLQFRDADAARAFFERGTTEASAGDPHITVKESKIIWRAAVGDRADYGKSSVISLVGDTVISFVVEWDDYQDAEIPYHFLAEQILENLGY